MRTRALAGSFLALLPTALLAQTVTRFEQNDPRITYIGTWDTNTNPLESGGSAVLANLNGSQAQILFNGTGITWIGESDYYSGNCYLTLDGVVISVDTSNPSSSTLYQKAMWSSGTLSPGLHRLTIESLHSHDDSTNQAWIWIDAFDVQNGTLVDPSQVAASTNVDQTDPSINYLGHWFTQSGAQYSGGSVNMAVDPGARADFTFNGSAVTWIGYRDQWSGQAQVLLDGAVQQTVDTYLNPSAAQTVTYSLSGLSPGKHVLSIVVVGTHSSDSAGDWVWLDGFQLSASAAIGPPAASPPSIHAGGIVSAASYSAAPVAPGQLISIFGENFLASGNANATQLPLPTQLGPQNTSVTACGQPLPLYAVYPGQINAQLPMECPTSGTATATVTVGGQTATQTFSVAPASPAIFTVNGSGSGDGIVVHGDNSLVSAAKPASAGEEVVIYCTGLGATNPSFGTGAVANQMNNAALPVKVSVGGKAATVVYSGMTQGSIGLYQINAIMPSGLTGSQPIVVSVNSSYSSPSGVNTWMQ